jgi:hypothetical protein
MLWRMMRRRGRWTRNVAVSIKKERRRMHAMELNAVDLLRDLIVRMTVPREVVLVAATAPLHLRVVPAVVDRGGGIVRDEIVGGIDPEEVEEDGAKGVDRTRLPLLVAARVAAAAAVVEAHLLPDQIEANPESARSRLKFLLRITKLHPNRMMIEKAIQRSSYQ